MIPITTYADFREASADTLTYLHGRIGFGLWMVTRAEGDDWIVLHAEDHGYRIKSGYVFPWNDSFCSRMVLGRGPRVAPSSGAVPAYATAPFSQKLPIGSYIGVPLQRTDGSLFGTLCAVDPQPMPEQIVQELPLIEMLARMLATILESELKAEEESRRAERAKAEAMTDSLTGLYNRRGWGELLVAEDKRCWRYGHPACVVSIDVDGLKAVNDGKGHTEGDRMLCAVAKSLRAATRDSDLLARIGGDEFAVLAVECDLEGAEAMVRRLEQQMKIEQVAASVGYCLRRPSRSLADAWETADQTMYEQKRRRKEQLAIGTE